MMENGVMNIKAYLSKVKFGLVLLVIAIFIFIVNIVVSNAYYDSRLSLYKDEKQILTAQLEQAKIAAQKANSGLQEAVTGLDVERVAKDDEIFSEFLNNCLRWKSADEYANVRNKFSADYKSENVSNFMDVILPDVMNMSDNVVIDDIYNFVSSNTISSKNIVSHVNSIESGVYSYFTEVTLVASNNKECNVVITYSVDEDGNLSKLGASIVD